MHTFAVYLVAHDGRSDTIGVNMIKKTLRFDEKDEKMLEEAYSKAPFARSDMEVIRFALFSLVNPAASAAVSVPRSDEEAEKPKKLTKEAIEMTRKAIANDDNCWLHPLQAMSECGCTEDTPEYIERLVVLGHGI